LKENYQGTNDLNVVRAHVGLLVIVELVAAASRWSRCGHGDVVWLLPRHSVVVVWWQRAMVMVVACGGGGSGCRRH